MPRAKYSGKTTLVRVRWIDSFGQPCLAWATDEADAAQQMRVLTILAKHYLPFETATVLVPVHPKAALVNWLNIHLNKDYP